MKTCTKCGIEKSLDEFYAHPRTKDRLTSWCKDCTRAKARGSETSPPTPRAWVDGADEKLCTKCRATKPLTEFYDHPKTRSGKASWCKECSRARARKSQKDAPKTLHQRRQERFPRELVDSGKVRWVRALKSLLRCVICGESESVCLDFHHRNPEEKRFNLSSQQEVGGRSLEDIKAEVMKCDPLCSNCHRKLHAGLIRPTYGRYHRFRETAMAELIEQADYLYFGSRRVGSEQTEASNN